MEELSRRELRRVLLLLLLLLGRDEEADGAQETLLLLLMMVMLEELTESPYAALCVRGGVSAARRDGGGCPLGPHAPQKSLKKGTAQGRSFFAYRGIIRGCR